MISFIVGTDDNRPQELVRFITHLEKQTSQDYEVIIADEGGGVNVLHATRLGCRYYWQPDPRDFHYSAKNMAARLAKGDYLAFPQDDAEYLPRFVEVMQQEDMVLCQWKQMEMGGRIMPPNPKICQVDVGGFTVKRDLFLATRGFEPGPLADGYFVQGFNGNKALVQEMLYVKH